MEVTQKLETQLKSIKLGFRMFGRSELRELKRILKENETVHHCVYGYYEGGSGILVATNHRVLLIDKRAFFLNLEDFSYETIKDVVINLKFLQAAIYIQSGMKKLSFRSVSDAKLKKLMSFIQEQIKDISQIESTIINEAKLISKPYLNPAWRSRHTILKTRKYPTKFYTQAPQ